MGKCDQKDKNALFDPDFLQGIQQSQIMYYTFIILQKRIYKNIKKAILTLFNNLLPNSTHLQARKQPPRDTSYLDYQNNTDRRSSKSLNIPSVSKNHPYPHCTSQISVPL